MYTLLWMFVVGECWKLPGECWQIKKVNIHKMVLVNVDKNSINIENI